jgi:hypothetical protein
LYAGITTEISGLFAINYFSKIGKVYKPNSATMYFRSDTNVNKPYFEDLIKFMEEASGKYLTGTGISDKTNLL